jgi:hypothetical protein
MNPRKEIEFDWGGTVIRSRPTLAKVAEIETKFGSVPVLARRCSQLELAVAKEQLPILAVMLRGCEGAPKGDPNIIEGAYEMGAIRFVNPMTFWLIAAYSVDEPVETDPNPGN